MQSNERVCGLASIDSQLWNGESYMHLCLPAQVGTSADTSSTNSSSMRIDGYVMHMSAT